MKKRVCILRSNPVDPDSRVEKEAAALHEAGYDVEIFCWDRASDHPITKAHLSNMSIQVYRRGCKASYGAGMKSLLPFLKFQFSMVAWILRHGKTYDVFHACDFDTACFSYLPVKFHRAKFVFDVFDFICGTPQNLLQAAIKKIQLCLIDKSDLTIICTKQRKKQIAGSKPRKLIVVHNSPAENFPKEMSATKVDKSRISVVYVGILQEHRLLRQMADYFCSHPQFDFYIAGFGKLEDFFIQAASNHANIHFLGKISYASALALEKQCDIMTAIYDPEIENHKFAAPNKFYEALMLGKPLIMVKNTGMSDIVKKYALGAVIDYSAEGFANGMEKVIGLKTNWGVISTKMQSIYHNHFSWDEMKKRLINAYGEILTIPQQQENI